MSLHGQQLQLQLYLWMLWYKLKQWCHTEMVHPHKLLKTGMDSS